MVDIPWVGLPNWIAAVATVIATGAAITAGVWAAKAAKSTKAQADAAELGLAQANTHFDAQLAVAKDDLEIAHSTALTQQAAAERSDRRLAEAGLAAQAPAIYAIATLREVTADLQTGDLRSLIEFRDQNQDDDTWMPNIGLPFDDARRVLFRVTIDMIFTNVSDRIAVVAMEQYPACGEVDRRGFSLPPDGRNSVTWVRTLTSEEVRENSSGQVFDLSFQVWDVAHAVQDTYRFFGGLQFFETDGTRLLVTKKPPDFELHWRDGLIAHHTERIYPKLAELAL